MGPVSALLFDELGYDPDDGAIELQNLDGEAADASALTALASGIAVGRVIAARAGARRVAIARLASGRLIVVDDECPHDGGRISDGFVDGERLVCARHGWELEARNGRCERACKLRE
jgi:nitrite reductase/ring-hydroxylating ferredoxin subunit